MTRSTIDQLLTKFQSGELSRRSFIRRATAVGVSASAAGMLAQGVSAQDDDATPDDEAPEDDAPAANGMATTSMTRAEYLAELEENFEFTEPEQMGGTFIQTMGSDIQTLNPILQSDVYSGYFTGTFVFDGLVATSQITGDLVPGGLTDYWEVAEDGVTHTFHLFEDNMWHDGTPLTAHDCAFSFDATLAEDSLSVRQGSVAPILESYRAVDDHTFELVATEPLATFLNETVGLVGIVPQHIWEDVPFAEWGSDGGATGVEPERVVGSGRFRFVSRTENDNVTIERNEDYRDPEQVPFIDQYIYQVVEEASSRVQALQTGGTDLIEVPFEQADTLMESNPELQITSYDTTSFNYYYVNQDEGSTPLFVDPRVRQALHYALDRQLIAEVTYQGYAIQADGTQPVLSIAYQPDEVNTIYDYNPEMAMELLEEAGWTPGDDGILVNEDGDRFSFECIYSEGSATYETQIPYMQQAWGEVGIEMLPSAVPFPTLTEASNSGNFEMSVAGFNWSLHGGQHTMFSCDQTPPSGFNRMSYCNEEYDDLASQAQRELDDETRLELLTEASNIVNDEMAVGIIVFRQEIAGATPRVQNFHPNGYSLIWSMDRVWLAE